MLGAGYGALVSPANSVALKNTHPSDRPGIPGESLSLLAVSLYLIAVFFAIQRRYTRDQDRGERRTKRKPRWWAGVFQSSCAANGSRVLLLANFRMWSRWSQAQRRR